MQKISQPRVQLYGKRGFSISLPPIYKNDNNIDKGDYINVYRTNIDGKDALVLIPEKAKEHSNISLES